MVDLLSINDNTFIADTFGKEILANDNIVKVLHGGSSDKVWIHRDFGIIIKNIFDTQDIYQMLGGKKLALNHLWSIFCNYEMDSATKTKFQTSRWSQRPLPADMIAYAANDSRYLICLRYKLIMLALEGPTAEFRSEHPHIKGPLKNKQLNKLQIKMQKDEMLKKHNHNSLEKLLEKAAK